MVICDFIYRVSQTFGDVSIKIIFSGTPCTIPGSANNWLSEFDFSHPDPQFDAVRHQSWLSMEHSSSQQVWQTGIEYLEFQSTVLLNNEWFQRMIKSVRIGKNESVLWILH